MDKYIGKKLDGRYEIQELIGAGGMANVYKAVDRIDGSIKAVKILREEFLDNEELVRRFKNESKAIGLLSHPNIVKVFDVNFSDSIQYIVMEYLDGITLKQYIDHQKKLTWKDTVHFTTQILRALQHAHDRGIVHRDIKPQNIMMLSNGDIKVTDFGIARFSRSETRTITDKAIGSVHYISPEQAKGDITDAKADIYSVGVMMYEMLTGKLPFVSNSAVSVAIKQISDTPKSLREIDENIPEGLEEITLKAMAKDPAKRYQSAAQMLRDIEDFKKNPSIVFEYKYLGNDSPTLYIDSTKAANGVVKSAPKKVSSAPSAKDAAARKKRRQNLPMMILIGITGACVVGAAILLFMVFSLSGLGQQYADVELPDFTGKNITEVESSESYRNFKFKVVEEFNAEYDLGVVYSQSPIPPKQIKENGEITLFVSKGPEKITIPPTVDMEYGAAVKLLQNMGLKVGQVSAQDENFQGGRIVKTDPVSGTEVLTGSMITLYVNMPAASSTAWVPDLKGMTFNQAKSALTEAGLRVGEVTEKEDEVEKGRVLEQSVEAGRSVSKNTPISLVISLGIVPKQRTFTVELPFGLGSDVYSYSVVVKCDGTSIGSTTISKQYENKPTWSLTFTENGEKTYLVYIRDGNNAEHLHSTYVVNFETGDVKVTRESNALFNYTTPQARPKVNSVTVNEATLAIKVGESAAVTATVDADADADKTVTWTSSDSNIATVGADGSVTAVAEGSCTITATAGGVASSNSCSVTVSAAATGA